MTFLAAIGGFLGRVPGWLWLVLGLFCCGLLYGHWRFNAGQADVQGKWNASIARGKAEVERLKAEAGKVTVKVETKYLDRIQTIKVKGDTIVQKVPVYVPADLPDLPGGWRLLHDAAAEGAVPDPANEPDAAPVSPQTAASTVASNYTQCLATAEQLRGLQEWVTEQKRLNP